MKLKNIFAIFTVLFIAASCSMDNDVIEQEVSATTGDAALNVQISMAEPISSKATTSVTLDGKDSILGQDITSCSILLLRGDNVIAVKDGVGLNADKKTLNTTLMIKAALNETLKVVVIANSSNPFSACKVYSDIVQVMQTNVSLLPKIGESSLTISHVSPSTALSVNNLNTVNVTLTQIASAIQLYQFNVTANSFSTTNKKDVKITRVVLLNDRNSSTTQLDGLTGTISESGVHVWDGEQIVYTASDQARYPLSTKPVGYTFPSKITETKPVQLYLEGFVGNKMFYKYYDIQTEKDKKYVKSGFLYRLIVNMTVNSDEIDFDITCTTADWVYNKIEIAL